MPRTFTFKDPPKNWSMSLAKRLERGNPLDRQVALALVGRPQRFAELEPLLGKRGKNNLTQALKRLERDAIVQMSTDFRVVPPHDYYELTFIGVRAVLALAGRAYVEFLAAQAGIQPRSTANA